MFIYILKYPTNIHTQTNKRVLILMIFINFKKCFHVEIVGVECRVLKLIFGFTIAMYTNIIVLKVVRCYEDETNVTL